MECLASKSHLKGCFEVDARTVNQVLSTLWKMNIDYSPWHGADYQNTTSHVLLQVDRPPILCMLLRGIWTL